MTNAMSEETTRSAVAERLETKRRLRKVGTMLLGATVGFAVAQAGLNELGRRANRREALEALKAGRSFTPEQWDALTEADRAALKKVYRERQREQREVLADQLASLASFDPDILAQVAGQTSAAGLTSLQASSDLRRDPLAELRPSESGMRRHDLRHFGSYAVAAVCGFAGIVLLMYGYLKPPYFP